MINSMVTINDEYMASKSRNDSTVIEGKRENHTSTLLDFHLDNASSRQPLVTTGVVSVLAIESTGNNQRNGDKSKISTYLDMPLLVSDHDGEDSEGENPNSAKHSSADEGESGNPVLSATQVVKRSMKEENSKEETEETKTHKAGSDISTESSNTRFIELQKNDESSVTLLSAPKFSLQQQNLNTESFNCERNKIMKIVVKYVAMKITNSFPPQSSRTVDPAEMPLDEYLMILVSRLQLSLPLFMKGIIYLFRYMDIIYLLRYVNQSNNFANYTDMGYGLKKLIIGCYRLVLARERKINDWSKITGLSNAQINDIVKTLVGRLNGKLLIKNVELIRLRGEIFRFVKMVTKTV